MSARRQGRLSDAQTLDALRLIRSENVGPRTFRALVARYGTVTQAIAALPELARRGGARRSIRVATREEAEWEMEAMARTGMRFVAWSGPEYPPALAAIDAAPPLISVRGNLEVLQSPMVAIVGSRNASAAGLTFTERLARGLGQAGLAIASGLARGIDARAHRATIETGTVAVLPGGQDQVYPPDHASLLDHIIERGAAVSEMPMGWVPRGQDFPRRNRIVAGLALATVVVEAARRSGSLITARYANEQGREVFAVPGSPLDPRAEGANDLLKQGASLCTRPEDVIDALQPLLADGWRKTEPPRREAPDAPRSWREGDLFSEGGDGEAADLAANLTADAGRYDYDGSAALRPPADLGVSERLAGLLGPSAIGIDEMARALDAPIREVHQAVLELELAGRLARHGGNRISLRSEYL